MSGVYIKGTEMPTSCGKGKLFDTSHAIGLFSPLGWCRVNGKEIFRLSEKADFCPLVVVPEPHGRLIDADAVIDLVMQYCPDDDGVCSKAGADLRELLDEIEDLPTTIPASEEGET